MNNIIVATFYHFTKLTNLHSLKINLKTKLDSYGLKGTVLLANEGFNGTLSGSREGINSALQTMRLLPNSLNLEHKESYATNMPFFRLKVRIKKEIVTMGIDGIDPLVAVGKYVEAKDWNKLITDTQTIIIDARNKFEVDIGSFKNAINPGTNSFNELPQWLDENINTLQNKNIALFCTGGIRCEKATSYLKNKGINDVFHLKGGILKYLESIPKNDSEWYGECFVFDYRVSVKHNLEQGEYVLCYACRYPLGPKDRASSNYVPGVSCDHCISIRSNKQRKRYIARQDQINFAKAKGKAHIGATFPTQKIE